MKQDIALDEVDQYVIKNSGFGYRNIMMGLGVLTVCFILWRDEDIGEWGQYLIMIGLAVMLIYFLKNIFDKKPQIIIDKMGVTDCGNSKFFPWSSIKYVAKRGEDGLTYHSDPHYYMTLDLTDGSSYEINIDYLKIDDAKIKEAVNRLSGRKTGCL